MNLNHNPSIEQLKQIVAACDDNTDAHIVYVDKTGNVLITEVGDDSPVGWATKNKSVIQFRLETLEEGLGYVGPEAALDDRWMSELFETLVSNWQKKTIGYVDN